MWIILSYIRRNNVLCTDMAQRKHKKCTFYVKNKKICLIRAAQKWAALQCLEKKQIFVIDGSIKKLYFYITVKKYFYRIFTFIVFRLLLPSVDMAVILTVFPFPAFFALTVPDLDTVAYFVLLLSQSNFLLAPLVAITLVFSLSFFPAFNFFCLVPDIIIFFTIPFIDLMRKEAFIPL